MTDKDTQKMQQYAEYLEQFAEGLTKCCDDLLDDFSIAVHCMDKVSGAKALKQLSICVDDIKKATPVATDTAKKLVKSKKILDDLINIRY